MNSVGRVIISFVCVFPGGKPLCDWIMWRAGRAKLTARSRGSAERSRGLALGELRLDLWKASLRSARERSVLLIPWVPGEDACGRRAQRGQPSTLRAQRVVLSAVDSDKQWLHLCPHCTVRGLRLSLAFCWNRGSCIYLYTAGTCVSCVWSHSVPPDPATPWTVACQAPLSKEFSRQEYWSGLPFPSPGGITQGVNKILMPGCPLLGTWFNWSRGRLGIRTFLKANPPPQGFFCVVFCVEGHVCTFKFLIAIFLKRQKQVKWILIMFFI